MSLAHDASIHLSPRTPPLGRRGRIRWTAWKDRWLAGGSESFDPMAAEAMIAAARAAFAHLEIRRSGARLVYSPLAGWPDAGGEPS